MRAILYPSEISGRVAAPPSKSMAHRALICAALAKGESRVLNLSASQDITATLAAMRLLGASAADMDAPECRRGAAAAAVALRPCRFCAMYTVSLESIAEAIRAPSEVMQRMILSKCNILSRRFCRAQPAKTPFCEFVICAAKTIRCSSGTGASKRMSPNTSTRSKPASRRSAVSVSAL